MSHDYARSIWRSVRTTFILFVVLVPVIVAFNVVGTENPESQLSELIPSAAGMVVFAGVLAEMGRRLINHLAGSPVCSWRMQP